LQSHLRQYSVEGSSTTMSTYRGGPFAPGGGPLDRAADALREAMARLRERVAADRADERPADSDDHCAAGESRAPAAEPGAASERGVLHLLPPASTRPTGAAAPRAPRVDPTTVRLAQDLLALAYRAACQTVYACAVENEQRLRTAHATAAHIRATADAAAAAAVRQAEDENARHLQDVQRRSEALLRVVQAQLRALDLGDPVELPLLDGPSLAEGLPGAAFRELPLPAAAAWSGAAPAGAGPLGATAEPAAFEPPPGRSGALAAPARGPSAPRPVPAASEEAGHGTDWSDALPSRVAEPVPLGSMELVVGPFGRFSQLAAFTQALNGLPGVQSVATRQFYRGKVHFRVRYDGPVPFAAAVGELRAFRPTIVADSPNRLEVRVSMDESPAEQAPAAQASG